MFLKFIIILLLVIDILRVVFFVWTTVWYWPIFNGLRSMDVVDFLRDSDQKMFVEHRFSFQNISFNIIRENHILFIVYSPELREKILENRRKSGNSQEILICKIAFSPAVDTSLLSRDSSLWYILSDILKTKYLFWKFQ